MSKKMTIEHVIFLCYALIGLSSENSRDSKHGTHSGRKYKVKDQWMAQGSSSTGCTHQTKGKSQMSNETSKQRIHELSSCQTTAKQIVSNPD